jgi:hypothetical protein
LQVEQGSWKQSIVYPKKKRGEKGKPGRYTSDKNSISSIVNNTPKL